MPARELPKSLKGRRLLAWETLRDVLLRSEALKTLNPIWLLPNSTDFDNPMPVDRVAIRLSPKAGPSKPMAALGQGRTLSAKSLKVRYEVSTPGGVDSAQELWDNVSKVNESIERTLTAQGLQDLEVRAHWAALQAGGVDELEIHTPADWDQPGVIHVTCYEET